MTKHTHMNTYAVAWDNFQPLGFKISKYTEWYGILNKCKRGIMMQNKLLFNRKNVYIIIIIKMVVLILKLLFLMILNYKNIQY